jgi:hypothetical protein
MILSDLITACESGFASVAIDSKREGIEISSGGNDVPGDANLRTEPAALFATEALALAAWFTEFDRAVTRAGHSLIWIEKPYIETYRITLGDSYGTYRVVRDRYVARGRVAVEVCDGVALTNAEHPGGKTVSEDADINPESIVTIEVDEEALKPSAKPLKIKRRPNAA